MITAQRVVRAVCAEMGGRASDVLSPHRGRPETCRLRWIAMWVYRTENAPISWSAIGRAFGRDRTTVRYAYEQMCGIMARDGATKGKPLYKQIRCICEAIQKR